MTIPHNPAGACHCGMTHAPVPRTNTDPTDTVAMREQARSGAWLGKSTLAKIADEIDSLRAQLAAVTTERDTAQMRLLLWGDNHDH